MVKSTLQLVTLILNHISYEMAILFLLWHKLMTKFYDDKLGVDALHNFNFFFI